MLLVTHSSWATTAHLPITDYAVDISNAIAVHGVITPFPVSYEL
jgi:hypothetical protein